MRRFVSLLMVVVLVIVAYAVGAAEANGTLNRVLADLGIDIRVGAALHPAPSATAPGGTMVVVKTLSQTTTAVVTQQGPTVTPLVASQSPAAATATPSRVPRATARPSATATRPPLPPAALSLQQHSASGASLPARGWVGTSGVMVQVLAPVGAGDLRAEVEVRPVDRPFTGIATQAFPVERGVASITLHDLAAGAYHWQARLTSANGNGPWTTFDSGKHAFSVQRIAPSAPELSSPSNPQPGKMYGSAAIEMAWTQPSDPAGIAGYSYRLDTTPRATPRAVVRTQAQAITIGGLDSGTYYFHLRALDNVGNWSPTTTFPLHIDVSKPQIISPTVSGYYFNPALEGLTLHYRVTKVSHVTVGIYDPSGTTRLRHIVLSPLMPAGIPLSVIWNGRDDAGKVVPPGNYAIYMRATDRLGNYSVRSWNEYTVTDKRIVVSLGQQRLWAYQGTTQLLTTLVTTGNKALPTPLGLFHVMFARSPFTFHSPWPKGSPFYYAPSKVTYALYFKDSGYFIHDADWRSTFGPGSNAATGTPGQNYTGTHGCINVPASTMAQIYTWATPGTAVQIVP